MVKYRGQWYVHYTLPYSGRMYASFEEWPDAIKEAFAIEENRLWS